MLWNKRDHDGDYYFAPTRDPTQRLFEVCINPSILRFLQYDLMYSFN